MSQDGKNGKKKHGILLSFRHDLLLTLKNEN